MPVLKNRRLPLVAISKESSTRRRQRQADDIRLIGVLAATACLRCLANHTLCFVMVSRGSKCEVCTRQNKKCSFRPLDDLREEFLLSRSKLRSALLLQKDLLLQQQSLALQQQSLAEKFQESSKEVSALLEEANSAEEVFQQAVVHEGLALEILRESEASEVVDGDVADVDFDALLATMDPSS